MNDQAHREQMTAARAAFNLALTYLEELRQALLVGDDYDIPLALATTNVELARERLREEA